MPKTVAPSYPPKVEKPDDFDAFWDDVLREASAVPLEPELVPDPLRTSEDIEVFHALILSKDTTLIRNGTCRFSFSSF